MNIYIETFKCLFAIYLENLSKAMGLSKTG